MKKKLAAGAETFEFFERGRTWDAAPERFRLHAIAVQRASDRLAAEAGYSHRDRLLVSALLHDVGKLVLMHAYPGYPRQVHGPARTPEERLHYERRELGVDHALVGGVLARRDGADGGAAGAGAGDVGPVTRSRSGPGRDRPRSSAATHGVAVAAPGSKRTALSRTAASGNRPSMSARRASVVTASSSTPARLG